MLIFDGVFLMRPEPLDRWDLRIFVSTVLEDTVGRAVARERSVSSRAEVEHADHTLIGASMRRITGRRDAA